MVETSIFRQATTDEKKDFTELGSPNMIDNFLKILSLKEQEFHKKFKPFDAQCARIDFENEMKRASEEIQSGVKTSIIKMKDFNLDDYGADERFEFIEATDVVQDTLVSGMRTSQKVGIYNNYKCKLRGHGFSVFVPVSELEKKEVKVTK